MEDNLTRKDLLRKIQELEFALVELNLFLDTHPTEEKALMHYNMYTEKLMDLKNRYEMKHGPLTNFGYAPSQYPWQWVCEPWPWEMGE